MFWSQNQKYIIEQFDQLFWSLRAVRSNDQKVGRFADTCIYTEEIKILKINDKKEKAEGLTVMSNKRHVGKLGKLGSY